MSSRILNSARLELRPLTASDLPLVHALNGDPRVMTPLGGQLSAAECSAWLDRQLAHFETHGYARYVVSHATEFIGFVGLSHTDFERGIVPGVEVAWRLAFAHWGHGYATEAARAVIDEGFQRCGLAEVVAVTSVDNWRSRRVMTRLGMSHSPTETFDHPLLPVAHPLRRHVVYRLSQTAE